MQKPLVKLLLLFIFFSFAGCKDCPWEPFKKGKKTSISNLTNYSQLLLEIDSLFLLKKTLFQPKLVNQLTQLTQQLSPKLSTKAQNLREQLCPFSVLQKEQDLTRELVVLYKDILQEVDHNEIPFKDKVRVETTIMYTNFVLNRQHIFKLPNNGQEEFDNNYLAAIKQWRLLGLSYQKLLESQNTINSDSVQRYLNSLKDYQQTIEDTYFKPPQ